MTKSCFVVLVHGDRTPVLLGPMSEDMRSQTMHDLHGRYQGCGLHTLDVVARSANRVTAEVKRYVQQGE